MRMLVLAWVWVLVPACAPVRETDGVPAVVQRVEEMPVAVPEVIAPQPDRPVEAARVWSGVVAGILMEGFSFDSREYRLLVVDQEGGPGSRFADAAAAARSCGGVAAVNAGFFTPEGDALGLVVSRGKTAGAWNTASSLGSGVWHVDASGRAAISRREKLGKTGASAMRELIQAGPLLVENGRGVGGLDDVKSSVRTVILWDGGTRWWLGRSDPCTLAAMGSALAKGSPAPWQVHHALNLDGGRSAELWISSDISGGPLHRRPVWNRPVRNFLILVRR